ncbi:hypothetical protein JAAARDRAFT_32466 [Jaapia argillacea MUCL 33604]|uniref:Potassium channel domain-containing protein n=1 Tax=Jaapia argillacea MUCL 33604 TaxID=933084 RepID=A0A067PZ29_9AGAM|nr:hypothetical protein JAAARDRAFT_32466 [Jaapia argillacea MUCL 33604]
MACALVANLCLIARFMEKRVKAMTLLAIFALTVHDIINVTAVTIFGIEHRFDDGFTYGQAFWLTLCSTIASVMTNISLVVDLVRTTDFSKSGSGLTHKQRSLVIIVMILLLQIALGALINSILNHLSFIDGLYFTVASIETIGYGDVVPKTTGARVFICLFSTVGIINLGLAVGMTRETIIEGLEVSYRKRVRELRAHRKAEKDKRKALSRWRATIEAKLRDLGVDVWVPDDNHQGRDGVGGDEYNGEKETKFIRLYERVVHVHWLPEFISRHSRHRHTYDGTHAYGHHGMKLNIDKLSPAQLEACSLEAGVPLDTVLPTSHTARRAHAQWLSYWWGHNGHPHLPQFLPSFGARKIIHANAIRRQDAEMQEANGFGSSGAYFDREHLRDQRPKNRTHAQLGQMAEMMTRFAIGLQGAHVHAHDQRTIRESGTTSPVPEETFGSDVVSRTSISDRRVESPAPMTEGVNLDTDDDDIGNSTGGNATPMPRGTGDENNGNSDNDDSPGRNRALSFREVLTMPSKTELELSQSRVPGISRVGKPKRDDSDSVSVSYDSFKSTLQSEEKKAFYAKLFVAWGLFLMFWTSGSAIFMRTEGWSYGTAMYFCFISFATIGYGDYSPKTPAGRAVFVAWALLGVATMTILISVISEAYSSRYKRAMHTKAFKKAVNRYRETSRPRPSLDPAATPREPSQPVIDPPATIGRGRVPLTKTVTFEETQDRAQKQLEALPGEILQQARAFHEGVQYFVKTTTQDVVAGESSHNDPANHMPSGLDKLLNDIAAAAGIGERVKCEILQDADARNTLFMLSIEKALRNMIGAAEGALEALSERDKLASSEVEDTSLPQTEDKTPPFEPPSDD